MKTHSNPQLDLLLAAGRQSEGRPAQAVKRLAVWKRRTAIDHFLTRSLDVVASTCAIALLAPGLLLVALFIKLQDGGPVLFRQPRVTQDGRTFTMFKFRSMRVDAEKRLAEIAQQNQHAGGVTFKLKGDPRITPLGKFIRRYSIDELPQLINVLRGDMTLVGPRPAIIREFTHYRSRDLARLKGKQGLTCLWQIGGRAEIDFDGQVALDRQYFRTRSFGGDLKIILKTIPAVLFGKGAC